MCVFFLKTSLDRAVHWHTSGCNDGISSEEDLCEKRERDLLCMTSRQLDASIMRFLLNPACWHKPPRFPTKMLMEGEQNAIKHWRWLHGGHSIINFLGDCPKASCFHVISGPRILPRAARGCAVGFFYLISSAVLSSTCPCNLTEGGLAPRFLSPPDFPSMKSENSPT